MEEVQTGENDRKRKTGVMEIKREEGMTDSIKKRRSGQEERCVLWLGS